MNEETNTKSLELDNLLLTMDQNFYLRKGVDKALFGSHMVMIGKLQYCFDLKTLRKAANLGSEELTDLYIREVFNRLKDNFKKIEFSYYTENASQILKVVLTLEFDLPQCLTSQGDEFSPIPSSRI